ncbi:MAG: hypothetical protein AABZ77_00045 [Chloroflexota bacterium]
MAQGQSDIMLSPKEIAIKKPLDWLLEVLKGDIQELTERIHLRTTDYNFQEIHKTEPRLGMIFEIINSTVFDFTITGLTGNMEIQGNKCHMPPEIRRTELKHGTKVLLWVEQRVTKETVDLMVGVTFPQ